jgi:magnesium transporter
MIKYYIKRSPAEPIQAQSTPPQGMSWAVVSQVTPQEIELLTNKHGLDSTVAEDVLDRHELPRLEFYNNNSYIFFRTPQPAKRGEVTSVPLMIAIGDNIFLTATTGLFEPSLEALDGLELSQATVGSLLLTTLATNITEYENLMKKTARFIRNTGHRLRSHEATNKDFIFFVTIEDNLNLFQRDLSGMLAVAQRLKGDISHRLNKADHDGLDDIMLHIQQLLVSIASYMQSINSIRSAYSTVANNSLNQRMKVLTTLTLLVALPNVFYGMYGMNVALPFADEPWAYTGIVIFTIVLVLLVVAIVKRFKIL